jgi:tetratricopeptide (TPR) repeat protein
MENTIYQTLELSIELILKGNTEKAVELLYKYFRKSNEEFDLRHKTIFGIKNQIETLKAFQSNGMSNENITIQSNRITQATLAFIQDLNEDLQKQAEYEWKLRDSGEISYDDDKSISAIVHIEKISNKNSFDYFILGSAYMNHQDYESAFNNFVEAIKLNPSIYVFYIQTALCCIFREKYDLAIKYLKKAEGIDTNNPKTNILLMMTYILKEEFSNLELIIDKLSAQSDLQTDNIDKGMFALIKGYVIFGKGNNQENRERAIYNFKQAANFFEAEDIPIAPGYARLVAGFIEDKLVSDDILWGAGKLINKAKDFGVPILWKQSIIYITKIMLVIAERLASRTSKWIVDSDDIANIKKTIEGGKKQLPEGKE